MHRWNLPAVWADNDRQEADVSVVQIQAGGSASSLSGAAGARRLLACLAVQHGANSTRMAGAWPWESERGKQPTVKKRSQR